MPAPLPFSVVTRTSALRKAQSLLLLPLISMFLLSACGAGMNGGGGGGMATPDGLRAAAAKPSSDSPPRLRFLPRLRFQRSVVASCRR